MGCLLCAILWVLAAIGVLKIARGLKRRFFDVPPMPRIEEVWWGPRDKAAEDESIRPFKVEVSEEELSDLRHRLAQARPFTPPLEGVQHQYGINTDLLQEVLDFWRTKYDWRERETFLNQFPQFTVSVQGLRIHYIHVKPSNLPEGVKVLPLLISHGWGGSVREFYELIPLLTAPQKGRGFVFELIAPSLPGFGFSEAAVRPGLGPVQTALLYKNLMKRLGFDKYYLQGGDWGAVVTQHMAALFPDKILGLHTNLAISNGFRTNLKLFLYSFYPSLIVKDKYWDKIYPLSRRWAEIVLETGYMHIQATKPDTVGVALNDSPIGLAAYLLEKFISFTNPAFREKPDGGLVETYGYTKLLDNIMIYWATKSITTSMRFYAEHFGKPQRDLNMERIPVLVPTAIARFCHDIIYTPRKLLEGKFKNIVHDEDYDGGHFAAFELPEVFAKDIYDGFEKIEVFNRNQLSKRNKEGDD